jgi:hypothetical protein
MNEAAIMVTESTLRQASTSRASKLGLWLARRVRGVSLRALLVLGLAGMMAFPAEADSAPPLGIFIYAISRDGSPIGQQRMEFVNDGEKLRVLSHTELSVSLLGMSLYGFNQQVEEVHAGGKLTSLTSETDDDGTDRKVNLALQDSLLKGDYNGDKRAVDPALISSLFWQKPALGDTQVLDVLRGKVRDVKFRDLGVETLMLPVGKVETHHYQMTGEWKRDLWYDANGLLIAGELEKDGAKIRQELQQRP